MPSSSGGQHRNPTAAECAAPVSPAGPESREEEVDWRAAVSAPERLAALAATGLFSAESHADLGRPGACTDRPVPPAQLRAVLARLRDPSGG